jgi:hypothetical protein
VIAPRRDEILIAMELETALLGEMEVMENAIAEAEENLSCGPRPDWERSRPGGDRDHDAARPARRDGMRPRMSGAITTLFSWPRRTWVVPTPSPAGGGRKLHGCLRITAELEGRGRRASARSSGHVVRHDL